MEPLDDGPENAAALFEWVVPDFPPPIAVRREAPTLCGIPTWGIQAPGGRTYRLKVASGPNGQALVRRGAALLGLLTARGVPLPTSVTVRAAGRGGESTGGDVSVALET